MRRKKLFLGAGIALALLVGIGLVLGLLVRHEPSFYSRVPCHPVSCGVNKMPATFLTEAEPRFWRPPSRTMMPAVARHLYRVAIQQLF